MKFDSQWPPGAGARKGNPCLQNQQRRFFAPPTLDVEVER
jgi:hypothetical protein